MEAVQHLEKELADARGVRRIDLLIELSPFVSKVDPSRARRLAEEALDLAGRSQDDLRSGRALQALALVELDAGGGLLIIRNLLAARRMFERCGSEEDLADVHRHLVLAYSLAGSANEAEEALAEARRRHEGRADPVRQAKLASNAGILAATQKDYGSARDYFEAALALAHEHGIDTVAQSTSNNLGALALRMDEPAAGFQFFETALAASRRLGTKRGMAAALVNGGQCLARLDRAAEARTRLMEGLELATSLGVRQIAEAAHTSLQRIAESAGDYRTALSHAKAISALKVGMMDDWMASAVPRAKAEDDALRAEERYRSAQRMETLARIAGGAAHDFNNVLSAILGYAEIAGRARSDEARVHALKEIRRAAERGADLTHQLLNFARLPHDARGTADVNEAVSSTERLLRPLLPSTIRVELELDPDVPPVGIAPRGMEQVVMNLVINARDAMPTAGTLTIRTETRGDEGAVLIVKDTGSGIEKATLARIFEPLFTTKPAEEGTGLGLSTVRDIVEEGGGRIEVESEVDVGTTFTVFLR